MIIELIVYDYLKSVLDCPVGLEVPKSAPSKYVVIEKTSSGEENLVYSATFAIQSYGDSVADVVALNESVKEAMANIIELPDISKCSLNSDYNYTDTTTKKYRYQAVFDLNY